ncbi:MAG: glycerophosphodiester phosphodiesterase, partial [Deltaproteobacteria bacterium]|nr:glycerophosphodiester phosphodiesterase [Deltaproteobacteria bacterium]
MNWETSKKPLIIAHRGFTKNHLENTLEAVDEAIRLHVDGVEVDLRMTADGELV